MPVYEYYCDKCRGDVKVTLSISARSHARSAAALRCGPW
jgi:hypothetical protein